MTKQRYIVTTSRHSLAPEKNSVDEKSAMALEGMLADVDALGALKKERHEEFASEARKLRVQAPYPSSGPSA